MTNSTKVSFITYLLHRTAVASGNTGLHTGFDKTEAGRRDANRSKDNAMVDSLCFERKLEGEKMMGGEHDAAASANVTDDGQIARVTRKRDSTFGCHFLAIRDAHQ